jgi:hypothetical protein
MRTHKCPGCGAEISKKILACRDCWFKIPQLTRRCIERQKSGTARLRLVVQHFRGGPGLFEG